MKIDERIARCFSHLRAQEFEPLRAYFKNKRLETLENLAQTIDEKLIFKFQGEAKVLAELLEHIENAETLIAKLKANSRP